ncbi:MAG: methyltransferase domain-containing protein [Spirochaetaceae bacterium]|nr:MAG: methyltransferase domain-containing protein [Spirochaetaceae bacterium]
MNRFFATFPAGTYDIIVRDLKSYRLDELVIVENDDSSVVFDSRLSVEKIIEIRYFTNAYLVIERPEDVEAELIKDKYYSVAMLKDGTPAKIEARERAQIENQIEDALGLENNTHRSRNNFVVIERASGARFLTLRLARARFKREKLSAGELRPELAHVLCLAARIKAKHRVLDMFAGHGAIPLETVRGFGCRDVVAVDKRFIETRHEHAAISWLTADACSLSSFEDGSIDRVVTDPPWGMYEAEIADLDALYAGFSREAARVLKPDGFLVVLTGYDDAARSFEATEKLKPVAEWPILVSGMKARILKFQKTR